MKNILLGLLTIIAIGCAESTPPSKFGLGSTKEEVISSIGTCDVSFDIETGVETWETWNRYIYFKNGRVIGYKNIDSPYLKTGSETQSDYQE